MKFKTSTGREKNIPIDKYAIDWDAPSLSRCQFELKQVLRPYWQFEAVYEEVLVAGTKLKLDFFNRTKKIAIEMDGAQHKEYNKFFNGNSRSNFIKQQMRDRKKDEWCLLNDIKLIRLTEKDTANITKQWFREKFGVEI